MPAIGVLQTAPALSECCYNGSAYRFYAWRAAYAELNISHKGTLPYRLQTNGKIERFHRTLSDGWSYARLYDSNEQRNTALPGGSTTTMTIASTPPSAATHRSAGLTNLPGHDT